MNKNKLVIENIEYHNPLFVFAIKDEEVGKFQDFPLLFTGVGKINAAYELTKIILKNRPDIILNLGTAGSNVFKPGDVVCCTQFIQRDMDVTALGIEKYQTPFTDEPFLLEHGIQINRLKLGICGTGDSFETAHNTSDYNVLDMEAYPLAFIAKKEQIPFVCIKYITDSAGDNSAQEWNQQLMKAADKLREAVFDR
ncbi:5'-methylthioadenosine/S-adenosylhomocysteine nucleosidase family protein [Candidatus Nitrosacidococcus tergens]|uniref:Nucleosidase n=1 Tax=Candidatus Nitrosacidococcus tergens TaxID=553981 RepID=A0A7G1Q9Y6_9GAMM|nr:5'-methylthioadenosine/S-adenosylhomocysteine nucleosidase [Candidatus Nitrosacidococcus tergens]CAB1276268.1 Nucleosidase [Candidatus Nitrosacidococcus tergens]